MWSFGDVECIHCCSRDNIYQQIFKGNVCIATGKVTQSTTMVPTHKNVSCRHARKWEIYTRKISTIDCFNWVMSLPFWMTTDKNQYCFQTWPWLKNHQCSNISVNVSQCPYATRSPYIKNSPGSCGKKDYGQQYEFLISQLNAIAV